MVKSLRDLLINDRFSIGASQKPKTDPLNQDNQEEEPDLNSNLNPNSKRVHKFKRENYHQAKLEHIGYPRRRPSSDRWKTRFEVNVQYSVDGKKRERLVHFGKEGKEEYIDHKDEARRLATVSKIGNVENFLHPSFYKAYLLNSKHDNISDAYKALIESVELEDQPV